MQCKSEIENRLKDVQGEGPVTPAFDVLIGKINSTFAALHDRRTGKNTRFSMLDAASGAFAVFFTQSPSFLACQTAMQQTQGDNNARTLFQMENIPTDAQIRTLLDEVDPVAVYPALDAAFEAIKATGFLTEFRGFAGSTLIALDGVQTHSSEKIYCKNCTVWEHSNGHTSHRHTVLTPVIVAPGDPRAIPLRLEFVVPQDGHDKQDCEIAAAKRWLDRDGDRYRDGEITYLGDDLYSHDPFCRKLRDRGDHFILTCRPTSHKTLYEWLDHLEEGRDVHRVERRVRNKNMHWETQTVRYAFDLPLSDAVDALRVNWLELVVHDAVGKETYRNTWVTDWAPTDDNVHDLADSGRARWAIENGNNNTLKTKGYHLEHNFGHGKKNLSSVLVTMNILAFLLHTYLDLADKDYRMVRDTLPTRKTFFEHIRALTTYICFSSWATMIDFMMKGLEIGPYATESAGRKKRRRRRSSS